METLQRTAGRRPNRGFAFFRAGTKVVERLSYAELLQASKSVAGALRKRGVDPGERALLTFPAGLDFIRAFWGCVCAGIIPVPAPPIQETRRERTLGRLKRLSEDCEPALMLDPETLEKLKSDPARWQPPPPQEVAFLQYTSGSTRQPSGVVVTQRNIQANLSMLATFQGAHSSIVMVHWLPLYHDMGLVRGMLSPVDLGADCYFMDPLEFIQNPATWLNALSHFQATLTGAPNFGYELAAEKAQLQAQPDLSHLQVAFCSAEPIRHQTVQKFIQKFGPGGLNPGAFKPSYGLAEATVAVAGETGPRCKCRELSLSALRDNRVEQPREESDVTTLVACGGPLGELDVRIVSDRKSLLPDSIGEVWLRGPSVAQGYWKTTPDSDPFQSYLQTNEGPFLRTGDLGFLDHEGSLFITGREKDLILIRGQNFHPHDIEATLEE
ncbi:MAG: AMP-binding protein, partial [Candidatus Eremiobacteraeota bacterium]|nr:AMP-binding protein [Candidatus Eremiobacteraeota bacterium]